MLAHICRERRKDRRAADGHIDDGLVVVGEVRKRSVGIGRCHDDGVRACGIGGMVRGRANVHAVVSCGDEGDDARAADLVDGEIDDGGVARSAPRAVRGDDVLARHLGFEHIGERPDARVVVDARGGVAYFEGHDARLVGRGAGDALSVAGLCGDGARAMRTMRRDVIGAVGHGIVVVGAEVVAVLAVEPDGSRIVPHNAREIGIGVIDTRVDHGHDGGTCRWGARRFACRFERIERRLEVDAFCGGVRGGAVAERPLARFIERVGGGVVR